MNLLKKSTFLHFKKPCLEDMNAYNVDKAQAWMTTQIVWKFVNLGNYTFTRVMRSLDGAPRHRAGHEGGPWAPK